MREGGEGGEDGEGMFQTDFIVTSDLAIKIFKIIDLCREEYFPKKWIIMVQVYTRCTRIFGPSILAAPYSSIG